MGKLGPISMLRAKSVGENESGGPFATTQGDMLQNALAAARLARGGGAVGYGRDGDYDSLDMAEEEEEEEEEEDEDDPGVKQLAEESGARDLALGGWARARILDGDWFSLADI